MVEQLRAVATFAEDPSSGSNIHMVAHNCAVLRYLVLSSGLHRQQEYTWWIYSYIKIIHFPIKNSYFNRNVILENSPHLGAPSSLSAPLPSLPLRLVFPFCFPFLVSL